MTNYEIVTQLSKNKFVEKLVKYYMKYVSKQEIYSRKDYFEDFSQDIYIQLFTMDNKFLEYLYTSNELEYYIRRIIKNNLFVKNSKFYSTYLKHTENLTELTENHNIAYEEN